MTSLRNGRGPCGQCLLKSAMKQTRVLDRRKKNKQRNDGTDEDVHQTETHDRRSEGACSWWTTTTRTTQDKVEEMMEGNGERERPYETRRRPGMSTIRVMPAGWTLDSPQRSGAESQTSQELERGRARQ